MSKRRNVQKTKPNRVTPNYARGCCRSKYLEGKSNITAKRVTLLPGFLTNGFTSRTAKKTKDNKDLCVLNEDLHGLLQRNTPPRRSARLSSKNVTSPFVNENFAILVDETRARESVAPQKPANKSKSIFREINRRCTTFLMKDTPKITKIARNHRFCENFESQRLVSFKKDPLTECARRISKEINAVNCGVSGTQAPLEMSPEMGESRDSSSEEPPKHFDYFPRHTWVFDTPPKQSIARPQIEECQLQPAVLCNNKQQCNIYSLNPDVAVNYDDFGGEKLVEIDRNFMQVECFEQESVCGFGEGQRPRQIRREECVDCFMSSNGNFGESQGDFLRSVEKMALDFVQGVNGFQCEANKPFDFESRQTKQEFTFKRNLFGGHDDGKFFHFEEKMFDFTTKNK